MYRNWMNSLGVNPHVNYLYSDLYDGLIILQVIIIRKYFDSLIFILLFSWWILSSLALLTGRKEWRLLNSSQRLQLRGSKKFLATAIMLLSWGESSTLSWLELEVCFQPKKRQDLLLMCSGSDIMEGNITLTLALIWQLMRAYTLSLLSQVWRTIVFGIN